MRKNQSKNLAIFEGKKIRRVWDKKQEKWYFSVVDIVAVLTNQLEHKKAQSYWTTLKNRLKEEGSKVVTKCDQLKMKATDGKYYATDVADVETILRLIQSVPSPKAEPVKLWLARVGYERIEEINDPEKALNRSRDYWQKMGRSQKWIQQRMMGQEIRNKLTDYWGMSPNAVFGIKFQIFVNFVKNFFANITIFSQNFLKKFSKNLEFFTRKSIWRQTHNCKGIPCGCLK